MELETSSSEFSTEGFSLGGILSSSLNSTRGGGWDFLTCSFVRLLMSMVGAGLLLALETVAVTFGTAVVVTR